MSSHPARHIPYLSFHKAIIRELCRPQKDDLLILAKGLGMRRIVCALLKTYDRKEDLVLVVNATPADEAGIGDELGIMGVRSPGFRVMTYEMAVDKREELYRKGGLFSVTSKILVHDFLKGTVPAKLITGLVILHAEKVSHGSQEEFAIRLYRRENQSGFCKAFSDEPEMFAHGISPLRDMLINLNMTSVMIWPRYNEAVKVALATRQAEVVEMYQPMTDLMRQCQDAITECMEAMLVELKRDHSLNLDLEDLNVRNAQFKSFDTMVRIRLKPVWHKVGAKTRIHVAALTELRNLQTWLLEYDSATFASYINTLHRQFFLAQKIQHGPGRHIHDWFNAKAASMLVEASQARVSKRKLTMDNSPEPRESHEEPPDPAHGGVDIDTDSVPFAEEEEAMREMETMGEDENDEAIMEIFSTQAQVAQAPSPPDEGEGGVEDDDDELHEIDTAPPPPVFEPLRFDMEDYLAKSVEKRIKKGHEAVLEEQPKWSLLAKVLKEIEDTIARVSESHADAPGTNIVLVMCSSDRTCLQLRQYLTSMKKTDPPFGPQAGRKMMESLFLSNWQHEINGAHRMRGPGGDELRKKDELQIAKKAQDASKDKYGTYYKNRGRGQPSYKRRRLRGGATMPGRQSNAELEMEQREALMKAHSAFTGGVGSSNGSGTTLARTNGDQAALLDGTQIRPADPDSTTTQPLPPLPSDLNTSLMASQGVVEDDVPESDIKRMMELGLFGEDFDSQYGLISPDDAVIIRPYGGEDDDILLQELRPRFVVMYEPNLAFVRRLEVYKNCNPGLALRVYQMTYTNSFEEDRFLSTMSREAQAFKKLIDDRASMVIPIYNNNPRAPMRDNVARSKTTYSSRNAGGGESAEQARILVDIREMGATLPSLIDDAGTKVVPLTLTVGDYILSPKMCVERKALPDLEASLGNGRLHSQCEAMTAHYEVCILLIEFEEDKFGLRTKEDARRENPGKPKEEDDWRDTFYLQAKVALLALTFPRLRIIWSSSPHESVKILNDLKLNHDEPDELTAMMKGQTDVPTIKDCVENPGAVEMLRAIPGIAGHNLRLVMSKVESIRELVDMKRKKLKEMIGEANGQKAWRFMHLDSRHQRGYEIGDLVEEGTTRQLVSGAPGR